MVQDGENGWEVVEDLKALGKGRCLIGKFPLSAQRRNFPHSTGIPIPFRVNGLLSVNFFFLSLFLLSVFRLGYQYEWLSYSRNEEWLMLRCYGILEGTISLEILKSAVAVLLGTASSASRQFLSGKGMTKFRPGKKVFPTHHYQTLPNRVWVLRLFLSSNHSASLSLSLSLSPLRVWGQKNISMPDWWAWWYSLLTSRCHNATKKILR